MMKLKATPAETKLVYYSIVALGRVDIMENLSNDNYIDCLYGDVAEWQPHHNTLYIDLPIEPKNLIERIRREKLIRLETYLIENMVGDVTAQITLHKMTGNPDSSITAKATSTTKAKATKKAEKELQRQIIRHVRLRVSVSKLRKIDVGRDTY